MLKQKIFGDYGKLDDALDVEPHAKRILEIPTTSVGTANRKQQDVTRLLELSTQIKSKFLTRNSDEATRLLREAQGIMEQYKNLL